MVWSAPALATNWQQSYHDAGRTGFNPQETTLSTANVGNLQLQWGQSVAGGVTAFALADGVIYAQVEGDGSPILSALDAQTGATLWSKATGNDGIFLQGAIASGDGLVFAGCGFADTGGTTYGALCAYHRGTGHRAWSYGHARNGLPESALLDNPVYADGVVYAGYSDTSQCCGSGASIVALDASTGAAKWTYNLGNPNSSPSSDIALGQDYVYFACGVYATGVCAASKSDGTLAWSLNLGGGNFAISMRNGVVYANWANGGSAELLALDGATGAQLWSFPYAGGNCMSPQPAALVGANVYFADTVCVVRALRARNGKQVWSGAAGSEAAPSLANGVLYEDEQGPNSPETSAFDAATGAFLWSNPTPGSTLHPPPIILDGTLYITNAACGSVCAYGLPGSGKRRP